MPASLVLDVLAGHAGGKGNRDARGAAARFANPAGMSLDSNGNLFVADWTNNTIRKVVLATGEVSTLAGGGRDPNVSDGIGATASFWNPAGVALDGAGNLYVADQTNCTIRKVVLANGAVTTLAGARGQNTSSDGTGPDARFQEPTDLAYDGAGHLFVTDPDAHTIRRVVVATGEVTTLAGAAGQNGNVDGIGASARFDAPSSIAYDGAGHLFVTDLNNHAVRAVEVETGAVSTLASGLEEPKGITYGAPGRLLVNDGSAVRAVAVASGEVSTVSAGDASIYFVASDRAGHLYVTDDDSILAVDVATGARTPVAGAAAARGSADSSDGTGATARFFEPHGITRDQAGNLFVADSWNGTIRQIAATSGEVTTLAGTAGQLRSIDSTDHTGRTASFSVPDGIAYDGAGHLFVTDSWGYTVRQVAIATGEVTTLAGSAGQSGSTDGIGAAARFGLPLDIAYDGAGNLFVVDGFESVRKVVIATGEVTTLPSDFAGATALACDGAGHLFVATTGAHRAVYDMILATGAVSELAGPFSYPLALAADGAGHLFVADDRTIREVALASGEVTTLVGTPGVHGVLPGPQPAGVNNPMGLVAAPGGELFITDVVENVVLRLHKKRCGSHE
jgi:sugar lactone lactonase YvrE